MFGTSKGFTFIEITLAIAIIGVMAAFLMPRLFMRPALTPVDEFAQNLGALVQAGVIDALDSGRAQRVMFDFKNSTVKLETLQQRGGDPSSSTAQFMPSTSMAAATEIAIPDQEQVRIEQMFVGNEELLGGAKSKSAWFFIGSDGRVQEVTIVLVDVERDAAVSLITNPFSGNLVMYAGARKP